MEIKQLAVLIKERLLFMEGVAAASPNHKYIQDQFEGLNYAFNELLEKVEDAESAKQGNSDSGPRLPT